MPCLLTQYAANSGSPHSKTRAREGMGTELMQATYQLGESREGYGGQRADIAGSMLLGRKQGGAPTGLPCGGRPCASISCGLNPRACRSRLAWASARARQALPGRHSMEVKAEVRGGGRRTCAPTSSPSIVTARFM